MWDNDEINDDEITKMIIQDGECKIKCQICINYHLQHLKNKILYNKEIYYLIYNKILIYK